MTDELTMHLPESIQLDEAHDAPERRESLEEQSNQLVEELFQLDVRDLEKQQQKSRAVHDLGLRVQKELSKSSHLLQQPLAKLVRDAEDGGSIANALIALQEQTNKINPAKVDFSMSTIRRVLAKIPAIGTPLSRWFAKYQSIEGVIQDIVKQLKDGKGQLERDNTTLKNDQITLRKLIFELQDYINFGVLLDQKISKKVSAETIDESKKKFVEEEILFPLKQRILDLQQQLAVSQQGTLTSEVIIRNNSELIRGVSRSLNVTITALNIAASLAVALQTQKNILKSVQAVNKTTDELLASTASNLKKQGAEIHKQAAGAQLDIDSLRTAFQDVAAALDDINRFRRAALPQMSSSITEMNKLIHDMDENIEKLENGGAAQSEILLKFTGQ